jgi:hypothetical protein
MELTEYLLRIMSAHRRKPEEHEAAIYAVLDRERQSRTLRFYITTDPDIFADGFLEQLGDSFVSDKDGVRNFVDVDKVLHEILMMCSDVRETGAKRTYLFPDAEVDGILRLNELDDLRKGLFGVPGEKIAYYVVDNEFLNYLNLKSLESRL